MFRRATTCTADGRHMEGGTSYTTDSELFSQRTTCVELLRKCEEENMELVQREVGIEASLQEMKAALDSVQGTVAQVLPAERAVAVLVLTKPFSRYQMCEDLAAQQVALDEVKRARQELLRKTEGLVNSIDREIAARKRSEVGNSIIT